MSPTASPTRLLAFLLILAAFLNSAQARKPITISHYICHELNIPDSFLIYVKKCGYDYVLGHAELPSTSQDSDWVKDSFGKKTGRYNWNAPNKGKLYSVLKREFKKADQHGLKLIPCFNLGSRWAWHWHMTNDYISFNTGTDNTGKAWSMPCFAPDSNGIDRSFLSYLEVVKAAFTDAALSYPNLDFIHLGHDEAMANDGMLLIARWSTVDQDWIKSHGNNADAYYQLMADEIIRRVKAVNEILPNTKSIIWADAWDKEGNGGKDNTAWIEGRTITIHTMNVTSRPELNQVKGDLILMPWSYKTYWYPFDHYNTKAAVQYFKDNGFKVIVSTSYSEWDLDGMYEGRKMMKDWATIAKMRIFASTVIGYCSLWWWDDRKYWETKPRPKRFLVFPEFAKEAGFLPSR